MCETVTSCISGLTSDREGASRRVRRDISRSELYQLAVGVMRWTYDFGRCVDPSNSGSCPVLCRTLRREGCQFRTAAGVGALGLTMGVGFIGELASSFLKDPPKSLIERKEVHAVGSVDRFRRAPPSLKSHAETFGAMAQGSPHF